MQTSRSSELGRAVAGVGRLLPASVLYTVMVVLTDRDEDDLGPGITAHLARSPPRRDQLADR